MSPVTTKFHFLASLANKKNVTQGLLDLTDVKLQIKPYFNTQNYSWEKTKPQKIQFALNFHFRNISRIVNGILKCKPKKRG